MHIRWGICTGGRRVGPDDAPPGLSSR